MSIGWSTGNTTRFEKFYHYDVQVQIGPLFITTDNSRGDYGLCDTIRITAQENVSRTAIFSFIPPETILDLEDFQGQQVIIWLYDRNSHLQVEMGRNGAFRQVFTGFVDVPSLDLRTRKVTLSCTDDRANQIIRLPHSQIETIGVYDTHVFGAAQSQSDELDYRMQTIPACFDFSQDGLPTVTQWKPKTIADFVFTSEDIKQDSVPTVTYSSRKATINTVNIKVRYSYQRLHQQALNINWSGYGDFLSEWFNAGKPSFPAKDTILNAASGGDWIPVTPPDLSTMFVALWPANVYTYNVVSGGQVLNSAVVWNPNQVTQTYVPVTSNSGAVQTSSGAVVNVGGSPFQTSNNASDINGANQAQVGVQTIQDTSSMLCRGASFYCVNKFAQNISETRTINVQAPQSVAKYGTINTYNTTDINEPYEVSRWENSKSYVNTQQNMYIDQRTQQGALNSALMAAYMKARHDILQVHRDVNVNFQTKHLQPAVDIIHTVELYVTDPLSTTAYIHTKAKVSQVVHTIDLVRETAATEVTLTLSRSDGTLTSDTPVAFNSPTQDPSYIGAPQTIQLPTHAGEDPTLDANSHKWVGWICNKEVPRGRNDKGTIRTNYTEQFVIDFPAIADSLRNNKDYAATTNLNVAIPNDFLSMST